MPPTAGLTGSRRGLLRQIQTLHAQLAQAQALLTCAAIQQGGLLLIRDTTLEQISQFTNISIRRQSDGIAVECAQRPPFSAAGSD